MKQNKSLFIFLILLVISTQTYVIDLNKSNKLKFHLRGDIHNKNTNKDFSHASPSTQPTHLDLDNHNDHTPVNELHAAYIDLTGSINEDT
jgi:hypothetical protein